MYATWDGVHTYIQQAYELALRLLALQVLQPSHDPRTDDVVTAALLQLTQKVFVPGDVAKATVESVQSVPTRSDERLLPLEEEELSVCAIGRLVIPARRMSTLMLMR